ncbi:iron-siderophore ABC transporter substrate-binding protein [Sinosporangium siamense]|uniref:Iron ABC transporter substrate-binding protein n=1 Tax=Sinosporangium siamense TaxID=1367973 RepID=A0A919V435_9ACTN|nr:iron-siderophore ABC transporter substrate-binding protein [Sinosporangium siamense]GII91560.1 iron ABC transporter substrate-binding protein [Sinosporangium siamense]
MLAAVRSRSRVVFAAVAALAALSLTACAGEAKETSSSASNAPAAAGGAFPVTIPTAHGDVVIQKKPERIVAWGWSAQDAVLALGVMPVAMPTFKYGGNAEGILPWTADKIKELGGTPPTLLTTNESFDLPIEEIIAAKPDLVLAPYSAITKEEHDKLNQLAPTVSYPQKPWQSSWQEQIDIVGKALGKTTEAKALHDQTVDKINKLGAAHPVLKGKTFLYGASNVADQLNVYRAVDPRVDLVAQLGMTVSPSVKELDAKPDEGTFYYQLSFENLSKIKADLLIMYFSTQKDADAFLKDPLVASLPLIKEKRLAPIVGESYVMASSAPTVLAIPWMLDKYVPELAAVAEKAGA